MQAEQGVDHLTRRTDLDPKALSRLEDIIQNRIPHFSDEDFPRLFDLSGTLFIF